MPVRGLALYGAVGPLAGWLSRSGLFFTIGRIGPSRAPTIANTAPLFSRPLGLVLFGQVPTAADAAGTVLIVLSVWILSRDRASAPAVLAGARVGGVPARSRRQHSTRPPARRPATSRG